MGINLDTGNYGFVTNYVNKPVKKITNHKYRRANLLLHFLQEDSRIIETNKYREILSTFIEDGKEFNGTNIWLSNFPDYLDVVYAHNQAENTQFSILK